MGEQQIIHLKQIREKASVDPARRLGQARREEVLAVLVRYMHRKLEIVPQSPVHSRWDEHGKLDLPAMMVRKEINESIHLNVNEKTILSVYLM